jgi:hypothetical protein
VVAVWLWSLPVGQGVCVCVCVCVAWVAEPRGVRGRRAARLEHFDANAHPYTPHPTTHTLHPTRRTLPPTPYTPHPAPYHPHPTPHTPRRAQVAKTRKFKKKSDDDLRDKAEIMLKQLAEMNTQVSRCAVAPLRRCAVECRSPCRDASFTYRQSSLNGYHTMRIGHASSVTDRRELTVVGDVSQSSLNGYHNVWIVKPAGKSRGRDIVCVNSINRLLEYIGYGVAGKEMMWVVQVPSMSIYIRK